MGGRQASAAAGAAALLSDGLQPLRRTVPRQRRRVPGLSQPRPARRPRRPPVRHQRRRHRLLPHGARPRGSGGRGAAAAGSRPPGRRAAPLLPRPRRAVQRAAPGDARRRRTGAGLHAGARGDAHLPESDRLQRPVQGQLARRVQRANRPLRLGHDLRCPQPPAAGGGAAAAGPDPRGPPFRGRARGGAGRGLRLSRSAVRAREPNGPVPVVYGRRLRRRRTGAAAAAGRRARAGRRVGPAQQFRRAWRSGCSTRTTSTPSPPACGRARCRPGGRSTRARPCGAPCASDLITNIV